jgi:hypothetical protein
MVLALVVTFILGLVVGMFFGVISLSLCLIGKRTDTQVEASLLQDTLATNKYVRTGTTM